MFNLCEVQYAGSLCFSGQPLTNRTEFPASRVSRARSCPPTARPFVRRGLSRRFHRFDRRRWRNDHDPAMLIAGIPPLETLGTNKLQSLFGSGSASIAYARHGHVNLREQLPMAAMAALGAAIGAILATVVPGDVLKAVLPFPARCHRRLFCRQAEPWRCRQGSKDDALPVLADAGAGDRFL